MPILGRRDETGYDDAEELIADLKELVDCGLITTVRAVGGPTRYRVAARDDDDGGNEWDPAPGAVFSAG
jgi:hypothetical protein